MVLIRGVHGGFKARELHQNEENEMGINLVVVVSGGRRRCSWGGRSKVAEGFVVLCGWRLKKKEKKQIT